MREIACLDQAWIRQNNPSVRILVDEILKRGIVDVGSLEQTQQAYAVRQVGKAVQPIGNDAPVALIYMLRCSTR